MVEAAQHGTLSLVCKSAGGQVRRLLLAVVLAWPMMAEEEEPVLAGFLSGNALMEVCDGTVSSNMK